MLFTLVNICSSQHQAITKQILSDDFQTFGAIYHVVSFEN